MTTVTDTWLQALSEIALGESDDRIQEIAVGTGTGSESQDSTALSNEVYRVSFDSGAANLELTDTVGEFVASIDVTAGGSTANVSAQNPSENDITEIAIFTRDEVMVVINEFPEPETIDVGTTQRFTFTGSYIR
jgi:hypothetical protein